MKKILNYIIILSMILLVTGCTMTKGYQEAINTLEADLQKSPPEEIPVNSSTLTPIPPEVLRNL